MSSACTPCSPATQLHRLSSMPTRVRVTYRLNFILMAIFDCDDFVMLFHVSVALKAVQQLSVENVESEGSIRVRWRGVSGVQAYRLVWGPFTGPTSSIKVYSIQYICSAITNINLSFFCVCVYLRPNCGDCRSRWGHWVLHFVQTTVWHRVHYYHHPTVSGQHWGPCSDSPVQDRYVCSHLQIHKIIIFITETYLLNYTNMACEVGATFIHLFSNPWSR